MKKAAPAAAFLLFTGILGSDYLFIFVTIFVFFQFPDSH